MGEPIILCLAKRVGINLESNSSVHSYWRNPPVRNQPPAYLNHPERSKFLLSLMQSISKKARILEIGCNVGRNLHYLWRAGYHNLEGIEINANAIQLLRKTYPELGSCIIHCGAAGELLPKIGSFDLVFTMAVLMHIKKNIFPVMAQITKKIITIEREKGEGYKRGQFNRNYRKVFTQLGMQEIDTRKAGGMGNGYTARIFVRGD